MEWGHVFARNVTPYRKRIHPRNQRDALLSGGVTLGSDFTAIRLGGCGSRLTRAGGTTPSKSSNVQLRRCLCHPDRRRLHGGVELPNRPQCAELAGGFFQLAGQLDEPFRLEPHRRPSNAHRTNRVAIELIENHDPQRRRPGFTFLDRQTVAALPRATELVPQVAVVADEMSIKAR